MVLKRPPEKRAWEVYRPGMMSQARLRAHIEAVQAQAAARPRSGQSAASSGTHSQPQRNLAKTRAGIQSGSMSSSHRTIDSSWVYACYVSVMGSCDLGETARPHDHMLVHS